MQIKIEVTSDDASPEDCAGLARLLTALYGQHGRPEGVAVDGAPAEPVEPPPLVDGSVFAAPPPPAAAAPPPPAAGASDLDAEGFPWDERIHASTKRTNGDGTYARRRNTPDDVWNAVRAELRALYPAPGPHAMGPASASPPPPPAAAPPPAAPPPPPAAGGAGVSFPDLMAKVTQMQGAGDLPPEVMAECLRMAGVLGVPELARNPEARARMWAALGT